MLPITVIVLLLNFTIAPLPAGTLLLFASGTLLLVVGMAIFTMGADMAMMLMGESIGTSLVRSRKLWLLLACSFVLGVIVTVAEPDLQVLTKQVPSVPDAVMVASVALGVGIFLALALLRILLQVRLSYVLIGAYTLVFILGAFTAPDYLAVAFDAGGVSTGPITVPFVLALGAGVSTVRGGKSTEEDSFGLCGLCSIGPPLAVLIMGMFYDPAGAGHAFTTTTSVDSLGEMLLLYGTGFLGFAREVFLAVIPIVLIFAIFQLVNLKLPKSQVYRIGVGIIYTLVGLTIFLTGVNIGFMPAGTLLGSTLTALPYNWVLIPLSLLIGYFIVAAEPAVHVLNEQVEAITSGAISKKMMTAGLSIGVSIAVTLAIIRIFTGIGIWYFLLPSYALALALTFFTPQVFTAIAFDSGGIASGTMAAAFLLPFAVGATSTIGGNTMTDAFGIIGMVATLPLISIQLMGVIYRVKLRRSQAAEARQSQIEEEEQTTFIEFDQEGDV